MVEVRSAACLVRFPLTLFVILLLAACSGGSGGGRSYTVAAASLPATAASPGDHVNLATASGAVVALVLDEEARAGDLLTVVFRDRSGALFTSEFVSPQGPANLLLPPIDLHAALDGLLELSVRVADSAGRRLGERAFGTVLKDTLPPEAADGVLLTDPSGTPLTAIGGPNTGAVTGEVQRGSGFDPGESVSLCCSDGAATVCGPAVVVPASGPSLILPPVDLGGLADGPVAVTVLIDDPAGNRTATPLATYQKDTFVAAPLAARVAATVANPDSTVTAASVAAVAVLVDLPPGSEIGDQLELDISDALGARVTFTTSALAGGGPLTIGAIDLQALAEGDLTLELTSRDPFGNESVLVGTPARKDTIVGGAGAVLVAAGAANAEGRVNAHTETTVSVAVDLDPAVRTGDIIHLTIRDGTGASLAFTAGALAGPGRQFLGPYDLAALADGMLQLEVTIEDGATNLSTPALGSAEKDVMAPPAPLMIAVPASAANPAGYVNQTSAPAAVLEVVLPTGLAAGATVELAVADLTTNITSSFPAGSPGANLAPGLDLGGLADGALALSARLRDAAGNLSAPVAGTAVLDRVIAAPSSIIVAAGAANAAGRVTLANQGAVTLAIALPAASRNSDQISVVFGDGATNLPPAVATGLDGGGVRGLTGLDASALADGPGTIGGTVSDLAGNTASYGPFPFLKDTTPPAAPSLFRVAAGPGQPQDVINVANESAVLLDLVLPASYDGLETATVRLVDGFGLTTAAGPFAMPAGGGSLVVGPVAASALADGNVALFIDLVDGAGNATTHAGNPALKDLAGPPGPLAANVAAGGANATDTVNIASVAGVRIDVVLGTASLMTDSLRVLVSDGTTVVTSASLPGTAGAGLVSFTGLDLSALGDGLLAIDVELTDASFNQTTFGGTPALKDTVAPSAPLAAGVDAGLQNPLDHVNAATESAVSATVVLGPGSQANDQVTLSLDDGLNQVVAPARPGTNGAASLVFAPLDTALLLEGPLTVRVDLVDPAGNQTSYTGRGALKDVTPPDPVITAGVAAGPTNPAHYINASTAAAALVELALPPSHDGSETVSVLLSGGLGPVALSPVVAAPAGGGTLLMPALNAAFLGDGPVSVIVDLRDPAGNITKFNGTLAWKDVVAPAAPTSLSVAAGMNNLAGQINAQSAADVVFDVVWAAANDGSESAQMTVTDSLGGGIALPPVAPPPGGGAANLGPVDLGGLADGLVGLAVTLTDPAGNTTSFTGTPARKNSTNPDPPTAAGIPAGPSSPADTINAATATAVTIAVTFGPTADPSDLVLVRLSDGLTTVSSAPQASPAGVATIAFAGIDLSALVDGPIAITVEISDTAMNTTVFAGAPATKDTVAPAAPGMVGVPAGGANPVAFINAATAGSVTVEVVVPAGHDGSETVVVSLDDGVGGLVVSAGQPSAAGGGTLTFGGLDASGLAEGAITITVAVTDPALNLTTVAGASATKDSQAPAAPGALFVAAGAQNPTNVVNQSNETAVLLEVDWAASMLGNELAALTITSSGGGSSTISGITIPPGGGIVTLGPLDLSGPGDGNLVLVLDLVDPAGNTTSHAGTAAVKDATAPAPPSSAQVAGGPDNAPGTINNSNVGSITVAVTFPPGADPADTVEVILGDGTASVVSASMNPPTGGGSISFAGLDGSGLIDGGISLLVRITDPNGNVALHAGGPVAKDTVPPAPPTTTRVAATAANPQDFVNAASESAVTVLTVLPATYDGSETVVVRLQDGTNPDAVSASVAAPLGGGSLAVAGIDASGLAEGSIGVLVEITDGNGNPMSYTGTAALKDVTAPTAPSALAVAAGAQNAAHVVNGPGEAAVVLDVAWDASMAGNEQADVDITSSGGGSTVFGPVSVPALGGVGTIGAIDCSLLADGNLTLALTLTDPAGNATSFTGTAAIKDSVGPDDPNSVHVAAGAMNPVDGINGNNEAAVVIDVDFGAGTDPADSYFVTLSRGATSVSTTPQNAPATAGIVSLPPIDASSLANGLVTVTVELRDQYGNVTIFAGTNATKSSNPPAAIVSAHVAMTAQNPIDHVNGVTESSVTVAVVTPASYLGTESITVTLADGLNPPVTSPAMTAPVGSGTVTFTGLDVGGLAEGTIALDVTVVDGAANSATYPGTPAEKDVTAPLAPAALGVAAGAQNAAHVVNMHSENAVTADLVWDASMAGDESASLRFIDAGMATVTSAAVTAPLGGGAGTIGTTDLSALAEGNLTLVLDLVDPAGNITSFTGTTALKDSQGPAAPTAAVVAAGGGNEESVINPANVASVVVAVDLPGTSLASDQVLVRLDDGSTTIATTTLAGTAGSGTLVFPGVDLATLAEGMIDLTVELTDSHGNVSSWAGTTALKDTIAPAAPTSARVPSGAANPQDHVNEFTESAARVRVVFPVSYLGTELATVTVADGVNPPVTSSPQAVSAGGGTLDFAGLDLSSLAEGALTITVDVVDGGGNTGSFPGTAATKDTLDPDLAAVRVPRRDHHPEDQVSRFDVAALTAEVDWGAGADGSETATLSFFDGADTVSSAALGATIGAGTVTYSGLDLSALTDGVLSLTATARDPAGNVATVVIPVVLLGSSQDFARNIYAVNRDDDTISTFQVDANTFQIRARGTVPTGMKPIDIAIDALGRFAYVANETSNDVSGYDIGAAAGLPAAIAATAAGTSPAAIAIDGLARFLYVANSGSNDVSAYRIGATGALTPGAAVAAGTAPSDLAVDPAGRFLLVASGGSDELLSFAIDQTTGALTAAGTLATGADPRAVAVHPSGDFVYCLNETAGTVTVAGIDRATGALAIVGTTAVGTAPRALAVTADGLRLYTANSGSDDVSMLAINPTTGALTGIGTVPAGDAPSDLVASGDASHLVVAHEGANELRVHAIDGGGNLTEESRALAGLAPVALALKSGANGIGFVLRYAYVGNKGSNDVAMHTVNDTSGLLGNLGNPVATGSDPVAIEVHPTGSWLYVANEVSDSLSTFAIDGGTGVLTAAGPAVVTGGAPKSVAISPGGRFLYVVNGDTDDIHAYAINPTTGLPNSLGAATATDVEPVSAVVSANGRFLYVVCQGSDTIRSYQIDAASGALTPSGAGLATGIIPIGVVAHPSGKFVYVVNRGTGDVNLYGVDPTTGALGFVNSYAAGSQPFGIAIEPGGAFAYVVNRTSQTVAGFAIDQTTGALGSLGAPIAAGTDSRAIAVGPRGQFCYVTDFASSGTGIIYMYAINPTTGVLNSIGTHTVLGMGSIALKILADIL